MTIRGGRAAAIAGVVALAVGGYGVLDVMDVVPGVVTLDHRDEGASPRVGEGGTATAQAGGPRLVQPTAQMPVSHLATDAPAPTPAVLATTLARPLAAPALGTSLGVDVRDGVTGQRLYGKGQDAPRTPASTAKLLSAAAISRAGDGRRPFVTRVVRGARADEVVLVAGGDTLLSPGKGNPDAVAGHAGLEDLARATAASLKAAGVGRVRVGLDDSHARGPALAPTWAAADVEAGLTGPVTMLGMTTTRPAKGAPAPADPALVTTQAFAAALAKQGISVGGKVARVDAAPADAATLAQVASAPRASVLELALDESDNTLTEAVTRSAAAESGQTDLTFAGVAGWVVASLAAQGIDTTGVTLHDASGLTRGNAVPARVIADVLTTAARGASPQLTDVVSRLPVAAFDGTLHERFTAPAGRPGAGFARAKTGTLTGVNAIAGTVADADGRLLVYTVLADRTGGTPEARAALDQVVAVLARCGCR